MIDPTIIQSVTLVEYARTVGHMIASYAVQQLQVSFKLTLTFQNLHILLY